jgi:hypothetical protein
MRAFLQTLQRLLALRLVVAPYVHVILEDLNPDDCVRVRVPEVHAHVDRTVCRIGIEPADAVAGHVEVGEHQTVRARLGALLLCLPRLPIIVAEQLMNVLDWEPARAAGQPTLAHVLEGARLAGFPSSLDDPLAATAVFRHRAGRSPSSAIAERSLRVRTLAT